MCTSHRLDGRIKQFSIFFPSDTGNLLFHCSARAPRLVPTLSMASDSRFAGSPRYGLFSDGHRLRADVVDGARCPSTHPVSYRRPDGLIQLYDLATQLAL